MMKQLSESFAEDAKKAEKSLVTGDSIDRHVNMSLALEAMSSLEKKYSVEIEEASTDEIKKKIVEMQGKERYKLMKQLDKGNEKASAKVIARRQS